ncbi:MAG: alpha/beta hydrolase [Betaproteobacteria bacterium]|nr:alpha/beta hydrolase [Betaproteobacteria bacterium]
MKRVRVGDIELAVRDEGSGAPVLFLHGFPDSSHLWRHQVGALVQAGFRAIAPDLRGFGASDKPAETKAYGLQAIVKDVLALLDALGVPRAHVVCHDFGAAVGWLLASLHPQRVDRFVPLSVGSPQSFSAAGFAQREKSWYMLLFQFRDVAEDIITRENWKFLREFARHHPETEKWIADLSRPGALAAALNWYRANSGPERSFGALPALPKVKAPTLGVWSGWDAYLTEAQMVGSAAFVEGPWRYERFEGASHWLQLDQPDKLNRLLIDFLPRGG